MLYMRPFQEDNDAAIADQQIKDAAAAETGATRLKAEADLAVEQADLDAQ